MRNKLLLVFILMIAGRSEAQRIHSLPAKIELPVYDMEFSDLGHGVIRVQDSNYNFFTLLTIDSGRSWDSVRGAWDTNLQDQQRHVAFPAIDFLMCLTELHLYRSKDLGKTWEILHDSVTSSGRISFPNSKYGYTGKWKTSDSGKSWSIFSAPQVPEAGDYGQLWFQDSDHGYSIAEYRDPNDPGHVTHSLVWLTQNGGKNWFKAHDEFGIADFPIRAIYVKDSIWLMSLSNGHVDRTTDGGHTWRTINSGDGARFVRDKQGNLYTERGERSTDDGLHFEKWADLNQSFKYGDVRIVSDSLLLIKSWQGGGETAQTFYVVYLNQSTSSVRHVGSSQPANIQFVYDDSKRTLWRLGSSASDLSPVTIYDQLGRTLQTVSFDAGVESIELLSIH